MLPCHVICSTFTHYLHICMLDFVYVYIVKPQNRFALLVYSQSFSFICALDQQN